MSTNNCDTKCQCGLWDFDYFEVTDSAQLMTAKEYIQQINSRKSIDNGGHGWGYGYNAATTFESKWYTNGKGCGSTQYHEGWELERVTNYYPIKLDKIYGWIKKQCPLCKTLYALWMRAEDGTKTIINYVDGRTETRIKPPKWTCYDLSYFWAFNDKPNKLDTQHTIEVSRQELIKAWDQYCDRTT